MKLFVTAMAVLLGTTFTSCLNSNNESSWDGMAYATLQEGTFGGVTLLGDDGITYTPNNPTALQYTNGDFPDRVMFYYKFVEGEFFSKEKTKYNISVVTASVIPVRDFTTRPDTIQNDYKMKKLESVWMGAQGYLNTVFSFYYKTDAIIGFEMHPVKAGNDTLYVKLQHTIGGGEDTYNSGNILISFKMPNQYEIKSKYPELTTTNDSVYINIQGNFNETNSAIKPFKVKMTSY